ncbi:MAG: hypothetical protein A2234_07915 [Elusimicrobia bacterium RIFOXYA2_FULL_58_8]|nr:MAG: hypothetical protein A2234_07915 [Elusimicrobia bacterium RIFOXYA2_FULL_58_8]OGS13513.1 MAG: hypothetical protein A2285_05720 [Elusimicrobia bacterium RIFOXYA12_FULL_57_11]
MAQMAIFKPRAWTLQETASGPRVVIPSPVLWPVSIFLGFWLFGWTSGEVAAIKALWQLARTATGGLALLPGAFLLFWLAGWTVAGFFTWGIFLFSIQGREVVSLHGDKLRIRLETLLGLGWNRHFALAEMAPPRLLSMPVPENSKPDPAQTVGMALPKYSGIAITSGSRKWRLGLGLEETGAKDLLYTLTARFGLPRAAAPQQ